MGWRMLRRQQYDNGVQRTLRAGLNTNEKIFNKVFSTQHLAKAYPISAAVKNVRVNGHLGMSANFDTANWKMKVVRRPGDTLFLTLDDLKAMPKTDIIFDFKCIEGWSQVTHWGGVKFSDFIKKCDLAQQANMKYVGLQTPDKKYYVGIDMPSVLQKQTILCYEMNGAPLPMSQGYPLRLIIPVKYGIKHLKRIGTMFFSNDRPADYWAEQGYDYYSGL
jgi:DMSO/TMAO reductase YedYZ molybdopterin-dependent catalytic subunit